MTGLEAFSSLAHPETSGEKPLRHHSTPLRYDAVSQAWTADFPRVKSAVDILSKSLISLAQTQCWVVK